MRLPSEICSQRSFRVDGLILSAFILTACGGGGGGGGSGTAVEPTPMTPNTVSMVVSSTDFNAPFDPDVIAWTMSIVEYDGSLNQLAIIDFLVGHDPLPANVGTGNALRISGTNPSADLFMYAKRQVQNLEPSTRYGISWEIEIASNRDSGCVGAGSAPGESVYIVAGVTEFEPEPIFAGMLVLNIDKGNAGVSGTDALVLGDIATQQTDCVDDVYERKTLTSAGQSFDVFSNADGEVWLIVGIDSSYEGRTDIFIIRIEATFTG